MRLFKVANIGFFPFTHGKFFKYLGSNEQKSPETENIAAFRQ